MFGIEFWSTHRALKIKGKPLLDSFHPTTLGQVQEQCQIQDNGYFTVREPSTKFGRPAIILSSVEVAKLSLPFKMALIFKFFSSHISSSKVQKTLSNWGVRGAVDINVIDCRHLPVKFAMESDFIKDLYQRKMDNEGTGLEGL